MLLSKFPPNELMYNYVVSELILRKFMCTSKSYVELIFMFLFNKQSLKKNRFQCGLEFLVHLFIAL